MICWFFCHLFGMSGLPLSVFVVESALPVVSQVPVLAGAYGADDQYAATGAVLSTLCSFCEHPHPDGGHGLISPRREPPSTGQSAKFYL